MEKLKDKRFALQVEKATDSNNYCLFIAYVYFVMSESLCEDLLYISGRVTADELFLLLDCYLTEHGLKWENCVGVCMDGAQTMAGKRKGMQALIKKVSPNMQWTHCVIHREALASRQISPELNKVLTNVSMVSFIETRPLKVWLFWELNIQLCCFTARLGGSREVKCCRESLSSERKCGWFGGGTYT